MLNCMNMLSYTLGGPGRFKNDKMLEMSLGELKDMKVLHRLEKKTIYLNTVPHKCLHMVAKKIMSAIINGIIKKGIPITRTYSLKDIPYLLTAG